MVEFNGSKVLKDQWLSKTGGVQWTSLDAIYRTENPRVGGSIPPLATINLRVRTEHIGNVSFRRNNL
jgi:hypothetical protein